MVDNRTQLNSIGCKYYNGSDGYPINHKKAFEYFTQAADLGNYNAMTNLGMMYGNGKYVARDPHAAAVWYNKALKLSNYKDLSAAYNLGCYFFDGVGVDKNHEFAYKLFKGVITAGVGQNKNRYAMCCYLVGDILLHNYNNPKSAISYYCEAVKYKDIAEAWHNIGYLTQQGYMGVERSHIQGTALGAYEKAAELGYVPAMIQASGIYRNLGMSSETRYWIEKAAATGDPTAKKLLRMDKLSDYLK